MPRRPVLTLIASVLIPVASYSQSVPHDDTQIIDSPVHRSQDEKKPDLEAVSRSIIDKTNELREREGRARLDVNGRLSDSVREFSQYMARTGRYGHAADGHQPADRATSHGYEYCLISENIAYAFSSDGFTTEALAKEFVKGWKNSSGHRRNMLDPDATEIGVAVARSEKTGHYFAVQMFGRPKSLALRFKVVNESGTPVKYRIADETFSLDPRYIRAHELCRPADVTIELPAEGKTTVTETVKVENDRRYVIVEKDGMLKVNRD